VIPQPLSDTELEKVHEILERFGDKRAMNLEQLDGFLAALICGPGDVPQGEYLPEVGETTLSMRKPLRVSPYCRTLCLW
jgi:hypothetical protein